MKSTLIDWRLIPQGTRVGFNNNEWVVEVPYKDDTITLSRNAFNEALKRTEKVTEVVKSDMLKELDFIGVSDRLYPNDKQSSKTILELISEKSVELEEVSPLTNTEYKVAISFQLYRKASGLVVLHCNDTTRVFSLNDFEAIIHPKQILLNIKQDQIKLDLPNELLQGAIKQSILFQAT